MTLTAADAAPLALRHRSYRDAVSELRAEWSRDDLENACRLNGLSTGGTKRDLAEKLLDLELDRRKANP